METYTSLLPEWRGKLRDLERFLKAHGNDVKKSAKQLRTCLAWRDTIPIGHLIVDEFSAELAKGNMEFLVEVLMLSLLHYRKIWMFFALFMKLTLMMFLIEISLVS